MPYDGVCVCKVNVGDANEAWVMHVMPDPTSLSAIWVAQRVPDDHVTVVMNMFTIRDVNLSDTRNFMGSKNMSRKQHGA